MAFHIPFNQRNRTAPVVYIGFDAPSRPRRKFNWWGFNGLWMSLAAFATAGLLSPLTLLISMKGLKQRPRRMAVMGTLLSIGGCALLTTLLVSSVSHKAYRQHLAKLRLQSSIVQKQVTESKQLIESSIAELVEYRESHDGNLPDWVEGNERLLDQIDPWGNELRFDAEEDFAIVRSAGPDMVYDTDDDVTEKIIGKVDLQVVKPL